MQVTDALAQFSHCGKALSHWQRGRKLNERAKGLPQCLHVVSATCIYRKLFSDACVGCCSHRRWVIVMHHRGRNWLKPWMPTPKEREVEDMAVESKESGDMSTAWSAYDKVPLRCATEGKLANLALQSAATATSIAKPPSSSITRHRSQLLSITYERIVQKSCIGISIQGELCERQSCIASQCTVAASF